MRQFILIAVFIIALLAGGFAYFSPSPNSVSPMKFILESIGISSVDSSNTKKIQEMDTTMGTDFDKIHQDMYDVSQQQNRILDSVQDEQQALKDAQEKSRDSIEEARQKSQDEELASQQRIQDQEQRIQDQRNQ